MAAHCPKETLPYPEPLCPHRNHHTPNRPPIGLPVGPRRQILAKKGIGQEKNQPREELAKRRIGQEKGALQDKNRILYFWPPKNGPGLPRVHGGNFFKKIVQIGCMKLRMCFGFLTLHPFRSVSSGVFWLRVNDMLKIDDDLSEKMLRKLDEFVGFRLKKRKIRSLRKGERETCQQRNLDLHEIICSDIKTCLICEHTKIRRRVSSDGKSRVPWHQRMLVTGDDRGHLIHLKSL